MPQFQIANALPQVVWLILIFLALYAALQAFLPRVVGIRETRANTIGGDLTAAEAAREAARAAEVRVQAQLTEARAMAAKEAADAKAVAAKAAEARMKAAEADAHERFTAAEARVAAARTNAMASLDEVATGAAQRIVERLIGMQVAPERIAAAVHAAANV